MFGRRILLLLLLIPTTLAASTRLTYDVNGLAVPVAWPASAFPIKYEVDTRLAPAMAVIDRAFGQWSAIADSGVSFQSAGAANVRAGRDNVNAITAVDDLFRDQKCLAFTTPTHDDAGNLLEVDIQVDPSLMAANSSYNLQQVVTHEIGHLLGLDHSAVLSATMYPYVGPNFTAPLDSDDRNAIATLYPKSGVAGAGVTLSGKVMGDRGAIFAAQVVAMNDEGEPVATALTDGNGEYVMKGLPPGDYQVYAEPLDGPVRVENLTGFWRLSSNAMFPTGFVEGMPLHAESGKMYGNLNVNASGSMRLNPKTVGASAPGSGSVVLNTMPLQIKPATTTQLHVGGDGFTSGVTSFEVVNPGFHRTSAFSYASDGSYVSATFKIDATAPGGSAVILVRDGRDVAALTGALRVDGRGRARAVGK